jgi:hypothetical protein
MREEEETRIFIRTERGIRVFIPSVSEDGKHWIPAMELGRNETLR